MATTAKVTKKASLATDAVLGQGAASLTKAVTEIKNALASISSLEAQSEELSLQVASKTVAIDALDTIYTEKERQAALDLELKLKANAEKVVNEELAKNSKVAVKRDDYSQLISDLNDMKANFDKGVSAAAGKAEAMAKARFEQEKSLLEANFKAQEAGNKAQIASLLEKVAFLEKEGAKWEAALSAERQAGIERAKASAIGTVSIAAPTK